MGSSKKLITIDQSLSKTAMIEWDGGVPTAVHVFRSGSTKAKKQLVTVEYFDSPDEQIEYITSKVIERVEAFKPDAIVMEGLAFSSGGNATRDLAGLFFVLRNTFYQSGIEWSQMEVVPPTTLKSFARTLLPLSQQEVPHPTKKGQTLKRKMDKSDMINAVPAEHQWILKGFTMSGLRSGKDDVADAYHLGRRWFSLN